MTLAATLARVNSRAENANRAHEFATFATALLRARGDPVAASRAAEADGLPPRVVATLKSVVAGATTSSADELAPLRILATGFTATLTNAAFDAVLADANIVPLHVTFGLTTADATAAVAGEGGAKKVSSISFARGTLAARKAACLVAVSEEILRFNASVGLIENSLRAGIAKSVDSIFLTALLAATVPIASTGATAAAVLHDIRLMLDASTVSGNSRFHLIVSPQTAARLATMTVATVGGLSFPQMTPTGGSIGGIAVHSSDQLTTQALLIDASQLVAGADPVEIRVSPNASIQMDNAPTQTIAAGSPAAPVASATVSMFQTDSSAIICERRFGFTLTRASAAQSLSGVAWAT